MKQLFTFTFRAMGCAVETQLETEADGVALLAALPAQVEAIEARLSRFRPESELSRLNAQSGQWVTVSETLYENVALARQAAALTDGLYNPLVLPALIASGYDRSFEQINTAQPSAQGAVGDWQQIGLRRATHEVRLPAGSALDLGGIAKGWTAAKIADQLAAYGACLISIGGDIALRGAPSGQPGWAVSVDDPDGDHPFCVLALRDTSVVTSGVDYRRWQTTDGQSRHHIIDPRTGRSAQSDVRSVTIVHRNAPTAEAYAKAVLLLGSRAGLDWLNQQWDAAGMVICADRSVLATSNWLSIMEPGSEAATLEENSNG